MTLNPQCDSPVCATRSKGGHWLLAKIGVHTDTLTMCTIPHVFACYRLLLPALGERAAERLGERLGEAAAARAGVCVCAVGGPGRAVYCCVRVCLRCWWVGGVAVSLC